MGLVEGHTLQAKETSRLVAPFWARYYFFASPQATQTSGLCTLGFEQVKAAGLDLHKPQGAQAGGLCSLGTGKKVITGPERGH